MPLQPNPAVHLDQEDVVAFVSEGTTHIGKGLGVGIAHIVEIAVDFIHFLHINEDEDHEDVDGSLLGEPEAELESAYANRVQLVHEQYAAPI